MILDLLDHCDCYYGIHPNLDLAFQWLKSTDISQLPIGKIEITKTVYVIVKDVPDYKPVVFQYECHRRFVDIQCSVFGEEHVHVMPTSELEFAEYHEQEDFAFAHTDESGQEIILSPGNMVVLFPQDAHQPDVRDHAGRKIVVKVGL